MNFLLSFPLRPLFRGISGAPSPPFPLPRREKKGTLWLCALAACALTLPLALCLGFLQQRWAAPPASKCTGIPARIFCGALCLFSLHDLCCVMRFFTLSASHTLLEDVRPWLLTLLLAACALLGLSPLEAVGRGAGLSDAGLERKRRAVERALEVNRPDPGDPMDILCKVGGLDIAAMTGFYLGCAAAQVPVILDGAISAAAALLAVRLCPNAEKALLPSHWPSEPCGQALLSALGLKPVLHGAFHLGEGTGAVALMPLLDMAQSVYRDMSTFGGMGIGAYRPDGEQVPAKVGPEAVP